MPAPRRCVVVADRGRARIFLATLRDDERPKLVEHAELANASYVARGPEAPLVKTERNTPGEAAPVHPQLERRVEHGVEIERRFAAEIAEQVARTVEEWQSGAVVIAAAPAILGLLRELVQDAIPKGVMLKALAKDYAALSACELTQRLDLR